MNLSTLHLITCEAPPSTGGVSDVTGLFADALAGAGCEVEVWAPALTESSDGETSGRQGVTYHRELGRFRPTDLRAVGRGLDSFPGPRRIVFQWVPHGYGFRSLNFFLPIWLWHRARRRGDRIETVVHEPFLPFRGRGWRQALAAAGQRIMLTIILRSSLKIWVPTTAWESYLARWTFGRKISTAFLPMPSTISGAVDNARIAEVRRKHRIDGGPLIGHFSTFGEPLAGMLMAQLAAVAESRPEARFLLVGSNGEAFLSHLRMKHPEAATHCLATGRLCADEIAHRLAACDLLLQPYPDGATTRRTTLMAGLALGCAIVTTQGELTESFWASSQAVRLIPANDPSSLTAAVEDLLDRPATRQRLGSRASELYRERFSVEHAVRALLRDAP